MTNIERLSWLFQGMWVSCNHCRMPFTQEEWVQRNRDTQRHADCSRAEAASGTWTRTRTRVGIGPGDDGDDEGRG